MMAVATTATTAEIARTASTTSFSASPHGRAATTAVATVVATAEEVAGAAGIEWPWAMPLYDLRVSFSPFLFFFLWEFISKKSFIL
jgi:hypothetical protein